MWIKRLRNRERVWREFAIRRSAYITQPDRSAMRQIEKLDIQNRYVMRVGRQG